VLRQKAKALENTVHDNPEAVDQLFHCLDKGQPAPSPLKSAPAMVAYAMIHWAFDTSDQLDGYGFPFDCPHLIFYRRLKSLHGFVTQYNALGSCRGAANRRALLGLWRPLTKIVEGQQLNRAASRMEKKMDNFKKLRHALSIAIPGDKKALNDDGLEADMKSIEEKVTALRQEIVADKKLYQKDGYQKMIKQIDKYWGKLFADPITVSTPSGETILPLLG